MAPMAAMTYGDLLFRIQDDLFSRDAARLGLPVVLAVADARGVVHYGRLVALSVGEVPPGGAVIDGADGSVDKEDTQVEGQMPGVVDSGARDQFADARVSTLAHGEDTRPMRILPIRRPMVRSTLVGGSLTAPLRSRTSGSVAHPTPPRKRP
jgi:hypothetical protein